MPRHWLFALGSLLSLALLLGACGGGVPSGAVVAVGGKSISSRVFDHWLAATARASKTAVPDPPAYRNCIANLRATSPQGKSAPSEASLRGQCEQRYSSLKQQVLSYLITAEWVLGEAEEEGVKISDEEVIRQFNALKNQTFPQEQSFQKYLAGSGDTVSDMLLRVKVSALAKKLQERAQKRAGQVTEAQIASYYASHSSQYGSPETRDLRIVLTETLGQAQQARREIEAGKSFAAVAKRLSVDRASKNHGGLLRGVVKGQQEKALDEAVFAARQGVLSEPVKTQFGYYIFEVGAIHAGSQQTLAQVKAQIRQQLIGEAEKSALTTFARAFEKRWRAKTDCRAGYVVVECKQYSSSSALSNAAPPATSTTSTTVPAPSAPSGQRPTRPAKK